MANEKHLEILRQGAKAWNEWRENNPEEKPDLSGADLKEADLSGANLRKTDLRKANLNGASLYGADLREANLSRADLRETNLKEADLSGADLSRSDFRRASLRRTNLTRTYIGKANLREADFTGVILNNADLYEANLQKANLTNANLFETNLTRADLSHANLFKANFMGASMLHTNLEKANLNSCSIYGISAWDLRLEGAIQKDLIITPLGEPVITVDNLEVAQFIYLLLHNEKIRHVIDTITSKVVLILGRFTPERKAILDGIKEELRKRDYLPVLFDFQGPTSRNITETVSTLAHMAKFVIADITDARSIPQELQRIVPDLPSVPVQPLLQSSKEGYGMFEDFKSYPWVLAIHCYRDLDDLMATIKENVIKPAEAKVLEVRSKY